MRTTFDTNSRRGFTLIFAVLIGSVVLAIGLGIFNIVYRELQLSTLTRDSDIAFYVADAGAECALYWEFKDKFTVGNSAPVTNLRCSGENIPDVSPDDDGATTTWEFVIPVGSVGAPTETCTVISIAKNNTLPKTSIDSSGRNEGWDAASKTCVPGLRTVERTLEINF